MSAPIVPPRKARWVKNHAPTITITFGDQCENHVGMQKIGSIAKKGFTHDELSAAMTWFEKRLPGSTRMVNLECDVYGEKACVLVIKRGANAFFEEDMTDKLLREHDSLEWDKHAFMYGRVVSKKARYNLCYSYKGQEPDYENKKGRIVGWENVPKTFAIRERLGEAIGSSASNLEAEGNHYYDESCGIGWHGDAERRKVVGMRLGRPMPLSFQWYHKKAPIGEMTTIMLEHGDMYVMSDKATGYDWKRSSIPTLRHSAGAEKYRSLKPQK